MSQNHDCPTSGHCWHEEDGAMHQRHNARPHEQVRVTCCWCGSVRQLPTFANNAAGTPMDIAHGKHVPDLR